MLDFLKYIKCGPTFPWPQLFSEWDVWSQGRTRAGFSEQGPAQVSTCTKFKGCAVSEIEVRQWYLRDPIRYGDRTINPIMWLDFNLLGPRVLMDLEFPFTMKLKKKKKKSVSNVVTLSCSGVTPKRVLKEKRYFKYILFIYFYNVLHDPSIKFKVYKNYSVKNVFLMHLAQLSSYFQKQPLLPVLCISLQRQFYAFTT